MGAATMSTLKLVLAIAIACAVAAEYPPLVEELPQENSLFAQQSELFDALVQEQDPIFDDADRSLGDHDAIGMIPGTGDDPFLHGHMGNGFPHGGYPHADQGNPASPPDEDHKLIGYKNYRNPILHTGGEDILQPVFGRKKDAEPQDPIMEHRQHSRVDEDVMPAPAPAPAPPLSEAIAGSSGDYSERAIHEMNHLDNTMSPKTTSKIEAQIDAGAPVDGVVPEDTFDHSFDPHHATGSGHGMSSTASGSGGMPMHGYGHQIHDHFHTMHPSGILVQNADY